MNNIWSFVIGLFAGSFIGVLVMSLAAVAKKSDNYIEKGNNPF